MSTDKNGATVNPHAETNADSCPNGAGPGRSGRHHLSWCGPDSNNVKCSTCGEIRENTDGSERVLQPGKVIHVNPV